MFCSGGSVVFLRPLRQPLRRRRGQTALAGYPGDGPLYLLLRVLEVDEFAGQVLLVGPQVEVPMSAEVEEYHPPLAGLLCFEREVDGSPYGVRDLRRRDDALRLREEHPCLEGRVLGVGAG